MSCRIPSLTNANVDSRLGRDLESFASEDTVVNVYLPYFSSPEFIEIFGDYQTVFNSKEGVPRDFKNRIYDDTNEPKLHFDSILNKHFFLDKYNEKVYYPYEKVGLRGIMTINEIKELTEALALSFAKANKLYLNVDILEFESANEGIENHIDEQLDAIASKLKKSDEISDMILADKVETSLLYTKELEQSVREYFKSKQIVLTETELEEEEQKEEDAVSGKEFGGRKESFEKPYKSNMLSNIKMFLSLIEDTRTNSFGLFTYVPFDDVYSTLFKELSDEVAIQLPTAEGKQAYQNLYDVYVDKIKDVLKVKPYLQNLITKLEDPNIATDRFKNQFVSAFYLFKNNFLGSEFTINEDGDVAYTIKNLSEVGSRQSNIMTTWWDNMVKLETRGKLQSNIEEFKAFVQDFNLKKGRNYSPTELDVLINDIGRLLEKIGITVKPEALAYYINNNTVEEVPFDEKLMNINTLINHRLYKYILEPYTEDVDNREKLFKTNLFKTQSGELNKLSKAAAFFMEETSDASIFTLGKTKWAYSNPSYLDLKIAEWKKNPDALLAHYKSTDFNKSSYIMRYLLGMDKSNGYKYNRKLALERLSKVEVGIFNSLQEEGDSINASENDTLSYTDALVDYIHKTLGVVGKTSPKSWFKTALAADKSTEYQINYGIDLIRTNARIENGKYTVDEGALNILLDYFMDEYRRIVKVSSEITAGLVDSSVEMIPNYHTGSRNGLRSQLFPELSPVFKGGMLVSVPSTKEMGLSFDLYDIDGHPNDELLGPKRQKEIRDKFIKPKILNKIKAFNETLLKENIIGYNEQGKLLNNSIDASIFNYYDNATEKNTAKAALQLSGDLIVNGIMSQVEYAKMFSGDLAYYKTMIDYKKRIPATYTDGLYMNIYNKEDLHFNIAVIDSIVIDEPTLEYMKKYTSEDVWKQYVGKVDTTDAQAWITPKRWRFILEKMGKWTEMHDEVWEQMQSKVPTYTKSQRKLLAQPLKGVYFDLQEGHPVFLKYSQAVLVPNLVRNSTTLSKILTKMQNQNIDELVTSGGIKVGAKKPTKIHDDNGNLIKDFTLEPLQLNNKFWKLQQDLPVKGIKLTDVGSQIQKNIFQALVFDLEEEFELDNGQKFTGDSMIDHLTDISNAILEKNRATVYKELGIDPVSLEIKKEDVLYKKIVQQLEKRADVPHNIINALRAGLSPFGIPGATELFQHVFSSIINNELNKIKTNGGGFIQVADFGITKAEADSKGIKFTPWFLDSTDTRAHVPKVAQDENGNDIVDEKTGRKKLTPAGLFIPANLISQHISDYTKYSPTQLFGKLNKKTGKYEGGMVDQEVLDNIIGYRIPNQGLVSNDAYRILGILPEGMGDSVIAYAGITKKTGSDFDIDKMYLMTPSVELIDGRLQYVRPLEKNGKLLPAHKQSMDALRNMLINSYKSILLQGTPRIMDKVMRPLDMDFFQMDIDNLNKAKEESAFDNFDAIDDIETKIKYKTSKSGLGTAVNHTMDFVRGAMGDMAMDFYTGWGNIEKGKNVLDREYSEELSDEELEQYIADYNSRIPSDTPENEIGNPKNRKFPTKDSFKNAYKKIYIGDSFMALTNAFVDVANNPFIVEGNWVNKTNNLGFMLLRIGVHPFKINALLNQPIIKDYIAHQNNVESKTVRFSRRNPMMSFKLSKAAERIPADGQNITINDRTMTPRELFYSVIEPLREIEYISNAKGIEKDTPEFEKLQEFLETMREFKEGLGRSVARKFGILNVSPKNDSVRYASILKQSEDIAEKMLDAIEDVLFVEPIEFGKINLRKLREQNNADRLDVAVQEAILDKFQRWDSLSKSLSKGVAASRTDVEGKGKDIASLVVSLNKLKQVMNDKNLLGFTTKYERNGKRTVLGTSTDLSLINMSTLMMANPKFFIPYRKNVLTTFNILSRSINDEVLVDEALAQNLLKNYTAYLLSGFPAFHMTAEEINTIVDDVPAIVKELQEIYPDNPLLKELYLKEAGEIVEKVNGKDEVVNKKFQIGISNAKKSVSVKDSITEGFRDLIDLEGEKAEKLIKYAFLTSGGTKTANSFFEYIPYEWFNQNRFNQYLRDFSDIQDMKDINVTFLHQFMRHNLHDWKLVREIDIQENDPMEDSLVPNNKPEGPFSNIFITEEMSKAGLKYTEAFKTYKRNNHAPYVTMVRTIEADPFDPDSVSKSYKLHYELIGVKDKEGYYIRTTPLGLKEKKSGTKIVEYNSEKEANVNVLHTSAFKENNEPEARINRRAIFEYLKANPHKLDYSTGAFGRIQAIDEYSDEQLNELAPRPETSSKKVIEDIVESTNLPEKKVSENLDNSEKSRTFAENEKDGIFIKGKEDYGADATSEKYTPELLRANPTKLFIFGDNLQGRGKGGQAIIRNEPNAFGIPTKKEPNNKDSAFMTDNEYEANVEAIDKAIDDMVSRWRELKAENIVFPTSGLGTGLAKLKEKAPRTYDYLRVRLLEEYAFDNDTGTFAVDESELIYNVAKTTETIPMSFYDVAFKEEYIEDSKLKSLGAYSPTKGIRVRPNISKEEFLEHIKGLGEGRGSKQKKIVFDILVNEFGYDINEIEKFFNSVEDIKAFIIFHEISHLQNKDTVIRTAVAEEIYSKAIEEGIGEEEAMLKAEEESLYHPEVIAFETRATIDAFNSIRIVKDKHQKFVKQIVDTLDELPNEDGEGDINIIRSSEFSSLYGPQQFKKYLGNLGNMGQLGFDFSNNPCK